MPWSRLVDLEMDDESILDTVCPVPMPKPRGPQYPWGLRITLTHKELAKLGMEADCQIGDYLDLRAFACVTSVSKDTDSDGNACCRVELQLQKIAVEDESAETDETE